jgi:hypothetical protein
MRNAIKLTALEIESLKTACEGTKVGKLNCDNKREQAEWVEKAKKLKMTVE